MGEGECSTPVEEQPKRPRNRKKHLYDMILEQMEFYFSDANLTKDRFLSSIITKDKYIAIEEFLKFNKIKKLNCTADDIRKAVRKSNLIETSEDGLKLCRKLPIKIKENETLCTIYVENIKPDATHETLSQIFSDFGKIAYISVPKYAHNKVNKGFAFIEFETPQEANQALEFFNSIGCKIPSDKYPEELLSVRTYEEPLSNEQVDGEHQSQEQSTKKIHVRTVNEETYEDPASIENVDNENHESAVETNAKADEESGEGKQKKRKLSDANEGATKKQKTEDETQVSENLEEGQTENKTDKRKKKKNKKEKRNNCIRELGLQVLSKTEWKRLRNNYLNLQRRKMREFKLHRNRQKYGSNDYYTESGETAECDNDHLELERIPEEHNKLAYTPGVIVKLKLPEPCSDVKKLKNDIKCVAPEVRYVDIPLPAGSEEVFIRFGTNEAATEFCQKDFDGEKAIMDGDEEKIYWEKIENDRVVKFQKLAKKQRGRDKLLKKAEKEAAKHLRFDEKLN